MLSTLAYVNVPDSGRNHQFSIWKKDWRKLMGGRCAEYIVLLYTDKYFLRSVDVEQWLGRHAFQGISQATDAYLMLSHDPTIDGYPFVRLSLAR